MVFRARKAFGTFEKRVPGDKLRSGSFNAASQAFQTVTILPNLCFFSEVKTHDFFDKSASMLYTSIASALYQHSTCRG